MIKFLSDKEVAVEDKNTKVKLVLVPPTNAMRFAVYELSQNEALEGRIKLSEYLFDTCIKSVKIGAVEVEPARLKSADISDEETAQVYFACTDLCLRHVMDVDVTEDEEKK